MAQPATIPLTPQLRLTSRQLRGFLYTHASSIPTKSQSSIVPRVVNSTLQKNPLDFQTKHELSSPVQLRRPNQRSRLEISEDCTEDVSPSSSICSDDDNNLPGDVLRVMDALKLRLDEELYLSLINECTDAGDVTQAAIVNAHVFNSYKGLIPLHLANRLMLMYAACGDIKSAGKLFGKMPVKDSLSWAVLISAYSDLPDGHYNAMKLVAKMLRQPIQGEYLIHAIICTLRSCARSRNKEFGLQIHAMMIKQIGLPDAVSSNLGTALVQFYCMVDCYDAALQVFVEMKMSYPGTIRLSDWSSAITSCNRDGRFEEAILLFIQMAMSGKKRESSSLSCALTASAEVGTNGLPGKQIHADAIKHGLGSEPFVAASLVHMYSSQGLLPDAARSFEVIERPDEVCWNAMLANYTRHGLFDEAVKVLYRMKAAGVQPREHMINEVKMACTNRIVSCSVASHSR